MKIRVKEGRMEIRGKKCPSKRTSWPIR